MKRSDFNFDLPPELIAQQPPEQRTAARLLVMADNACEDRGIADLPSLLCPNDLLIFNDTRVIPARLRARKASGGAAEIMVERIVDEHQVWAFVGASKTPREGGILEVAGVPIQVEARDGPLFSLRCDSCSWSELLEAHGDVPLPPYIRRAPEAADKARYQTVFARAPGAVAAPTAGLHFDEDLLANLRMRGIDQGFVTLHVGAGTFAPVRVDDLASHRMHAERLQVGPEVVAKIAAAKARGGRVVAVGTTVVRALETAAANGDIQAFSGESRLFITPGYQFRVVDALLTNFHLPESTLMMLVCAFGGTAPVLAAYAHAVRSEYRFFSYGDAMWLERAA